MAYQQGPQYPPEWQGQSEQPQFLPNYEPPPGYGYPSPEPPKKNNALLVVLAVGATILLGFAGLSVILFVTRSSAPSAVTVSARASAVPTQRHDRPERRDRVADPEQPPAHVSAAVGDTLALHGREQGLVVDVTVSDVFDHATSVNEFLKPKQGNRYVAVELYLQNTGQVVYDDSPSNGARLIDDEGQQYSPTFGDVKEGVELGGSVTVTIGDRRKGVLVFEVPANVRPVKFQFALNSGYADQKGEWTLTK